MKKTRRTSSRSHTRSAVPGRTLKRSHHYVPQFWLRGFADATGKIYAWDGQKVRSVSSKSIMREDWLYTLFDNAWSPTDALEDALARVEDVAATLFVRLEKSQVQLTASDRDHLCEFLSLQACRHPEIMRRGRRHLADFLALIELAHDFKSTEEFVSEAVKNFGASDNDARALHEYLRSLRPDQLRLGVGDLSGMSEQDPRFPQQEVLRAQPQIAKILQRMEFTLIKCPNSTSFVLGDTPLPQQGLQHGFTVPISRSTAVVAAPSSSPSLQLSRRSSNLKEVAAINRVQWENSLHIVIGPDPHALKTI